MDDDLKEVYFYEYCKTCKHSNLEEKFDPCNECLDEPYNSESQKPVKWEKKE